MLPFLLFSVAFVPPFIVFAIIAAAWKIHKSEGLHTHSERNQRLEETAPQNQRYLTVPATPRVEHKPMKKEKNLDHFISLVFLVRSLFHLTHLPKIVINAPEKYGV